MTERIFYSFLEEPLKSFKTNRVPLGQDLSFVVKLFEICLVTQSLKWWHRRPSPPRFIYIMKSIEMAEVLIFKINLQEKEKVPWYLDTLGNTDSQELEHYIEAQQWRPPKEFL